MVTHCISGLTRLDRPKPPAGPSRLLIAARERGPRKKPATLAAEGQRDVAAPGKASAWLAETVQGINLLL